MYASFQNRTVDIRLEGVTQKDSCFVSNKRYVPSSHSVTSIRVIFHHLKEESWTQRFMCHKHANQKSRGPSTHRANRAKCHHLRELWTKRVQESRMPLSQIVDNTKIYEHQKSHEQKECQSHVPSFRAHKRALQNSPAKEPLVSSARIFPHNFFRKRACFHDVEWQPNYYKKWQRLVYCSLPRKSPVSLPQKSPC